MSKIKELPKISAKYLNTENVSEKGIFKTQNSHQFKELLAKFNLKRKRKKQKELGEDIYGRRQNITEIEEDKNSKIINQKFLIKMYQSNHTAIMTEIKGEFEDMKNMEKEKKEFIFPNPGFKQFRNTIYSKETTKREFYEKYQQFSSLNRKQELKEFTPSFAFIKGSNQQMILPNPLGLIKRKGEEKKLELNNQKVGDRYIKVLGTSLEYSSHLTEMHLKGNRLSSNGANVIVKSINNNPDLIRRLETLDLSDNLIGQNDISQLIEYIKNTSNNLENLDISNNKLGNANIILICQTLEEYSKEKINQLNLGYNLISKESMPSICSMLVSCRSMRVFRLNGNKIDNKSAAELIKTLCGHLELRILDLAWNNIGEELVQKPSFQAIANAHKDDKPEPKIYPAFELERVGKTLKVEPLTNPFLEKVDNKNQSKDNKEEETNKKKKKEPLKIPKKEPSEFAKKLGEYFHKPLALIHLDISHNNLTKEDCELISNEIKDNHYIMGIHVDGNEMSIDSLGFIHPLSNETKESSFFANSQIYYDLCKEFDLKKSSVETVRKIRSKNNCWICEGWREIEFEYIPEEPMEDLQNHLVKIHLSCDNYKPFDMLYLSGKFHIIRMCPPGDVTYFFTVDTQPVVSQDNGKKNKVYHLKQKHSFEYTFDEEYIDELNNIRAKLYYEYCQKEKENETKENETKENETKENETKENETKENETKENETKENETKENISIMCTEPNPNEIITIKVAHLYKKTVSVNHNVLNEVFRKNTVYTEPRPVKIINRFVKPRTPWTFPTSIWAYYGYDYEGETEQHINNCFEFDFNRGMYQKEFKTPEKLEEFKEYLRTKYVDIINCYKNYSSRANTQLWQITLNLSTEFINNCKGLAEEDYDTNFINLKKQSALSNLIDLEEEKKGNKNLCKNLVRHQFMNFLVKVAIDKYVEKEKTRKFTEPLDAVKYAFENHYDNAIKGFEYHSWRKDRYYNEKVDNFLKAYLPIFDAIYKSWASRKTPSPKDVWMEKKEFDEFVQNFVDINEYPIANNNLYFNYSIRLQVNEINPPEHSDRHMIMLFPEFLEGLCRTVDMASPAPPGENWTKERRTEQLLIEKLENCIETLIKMIRNNDYKYLIDKFPRPNKDIQTDLYIIDYDSPFYQGFIIKKI